MKNLEIHFVIYALVRPRRRTQGYLRMWDKIIIFPRRIPARPLLLLQSFSYVSLAIDLSFAPPPRRRGKTRDTRREEQRREWRLKHFQISRFVGDRPGYGIIYIGLNVRSCKIRRVDRTSRVSCATYFAPERAAVWNPGDIPPRDISIGLEPETLL